MFTRLKQIFILFSATVSLLSCFGCGELPEMRDVYVLSSRNPNMELKTTGIGSAGLIVPIQMFEEEQIVSWPKDLIIAVQVLDETGKEVSSVVLGEDSFPSKNEAYDTLVEYSYFADIPFRHFKYEKLLNSLSHGRYCYFRIPCLEDANRKLWWFDENNFYTFRVNLIATPKEGNILFVSSDTSEALRRLTLFLGYFYVGGSEFTE